MPTVNDNSLSQSTRPPIVAALFVDRNGPYWSDPAIEAITEDYDARRYSGPNPVVAHPPCERWGRFAEGSPSDKKFELGDDAGCFQAALTAVRTFGGVLEHPQGSHAFRHFRLPIPPARGWSVADSNGGRSTYIDQGAYGHPAKKPTWLYGVLPAFPRLDWTRVWGRPRIGGDGYHSSRERARAVASGKHKPSPQVPSIWNRRTPEPLRDLLLSLSRSCHGWKPIQRHTQVPIMEVKT